jgi:hypothetical protein
MRTFLIICLVGIIFGCVSMPAITPEGVSADDSDIVWFWGGDEYANDFAAAKGWKAPEPEPVTQDMWIYIAGGLYVLGVVGVAIGCVTHMQEFTGGGIILGVGGIVAATVAEISGYLWIFGVFLCILILVSIRLRGWSMFDKRDKVTYGTDKTRTGAIGANSPGLSSDAAVTNDTHGTN